MFLLYSSVNKFSAIVFSAIVLALFSAQANAGKITVYGNGVVRLAPDIASLSIGVNSRADQPEQAQADNARTMNALIVAIEGLGIQRSDMQTSSYSIQRLVDESTDKNAKEPVYRVSNSLNLLIRDLDKVGIVIATAVKTGGNDIGDLGFSVAKPQEHVEKALKLAFDDARKEAELSAKAAGLTLGQVIEVSGGRATLPQRKQFSAEYDISDQPFDPTLSPITLQGEVEIGYEVTIEYELK